MFPFLTAYDPPGSSEGTLDPLGLYQIADQLAVQLVPAVRERMQRVRFLTCMAVGSIVTEGLEERGVAERGVPAFLVWEWLVILALVRARRDDSGNWGSPGTLVAKRALDQRGYLDEASYLKTARIFGVYGVYKRLAMHVGLIDVHLAARAGAEVLADVWARDRELGGIQGFAPLKKFWRDAVQRSLDHKPARTRPNFQNADWAELADAFAPSEAKRREKGYLKKLLLSHDGGNLRALPAIWELQHEFANDGDFQEEVLHRRLEQVEPVYGDLLEAIRRYEAFARSLQDAFDVLKAEAARPDGQGFVIPAIAKDRDFVKCSRGLHDRFAAAHRALGKVTVVKTSLPNLFEERFRQFSDPLDPGDCAVELCRHHEAVQKGKSSDGKRPWFDRLGADRIYVRHRYRTARAPIRPERYVHDYRGWPIRRFFRDLS